MSARAHACARVCVGMGEWGVSGGFSKDFEILNSVTVYFSRCPARILRYCHQRRKEVGKVWVPISTANGGVKCVGESSKKMNLVLYVGTNVCSEPREKCGFPILRG